MPGKKNSKPKAAPVSDDPKAIPESTMKNFKTMTKAFADGNVCAMRAKRKADGKYVTLVCAMWKDEDDMINMTPFAIMLAEEGNPYDDFIPAPDFENNADEPKSKGE